MACISMSCPPMEKCSNSLPCCSSFTSTNCSGSASRVKLFSVAAARCCSAIYQRDLSNGLLRRVMSPLHQAEVMHLVSGPREGLRCRSAGGENPGILLDSLPEVDQEALAEEAPRLLALCEDLDLQAQVANLREEAQKGLQNSNLRAIERYIDSWSHEGLVQGLEQQWTVKVPSPEFECKVQLGMQDLHLQASLQAVEHLTGGVDSSFDWQLAAKELREHAILGYGQEPPPNHFSTTSSEEQLWSTWVTARDAMASADNELAKEAVAHDNGINAEEVVHLRAELQTSSPKLPVPLILQSVGIAGACFGASLTGLLCDGAISSSAWAAENGLSIEPMPESVEAATRAPAWLGPAVLAFPVLTYGLFNYYRENVNPGAKVVDWMFGVLAAVIIANIVLIATLGVRLY